MSRIRELRKQKGITQKKLAELIGADPILVSRWEREKSSPISSYLQKIARALGTSVDALLQEEGEECLPKDEITAENDTNLPSSDNPPVYKVEKVPMSNIRNSKWMLIYERDGERIELPPTEQGYAIINNIASSIVMRSVTKAKNASATFV